MALTLKERFVRALTARGYVQGEQRAKYLVFRGPAHTPLLNNEAPTHRYLVGASGALRYTKGRIDQSHPVSERAKQLLLDASIKPAPQPVNWLVL